MHRIAQENLQMQEQLEKTREDVKRKEIAKLAHNNDHYVAQK